MAQIYQLPQNQKKLHTLNQYKMNARGKRGEIYLYGAIGDTVFAEGITATRFKDDLKALGNVDLIDVRINSDGGDVFDGKVMYNLLREHPARKIMHVDGLAASIASLIAMAGDEIHMGEGAYMMIHNAWGFAMGDAREILKTVDLLNSVTASMRSTYASRSGQSIDQMTKWMDETVWLTAPEAKTYGFADVIAESPRIAACAIFYPMFARVPDELRKNRRAALPLMNEIAAMRQRNAAT